MLAEERCRLKSSLLPILNSLSKCMQFSRLFIYVLFLSTFDMCIYIYINISFRFAHILFVLNISFMLKRISDLVFQKLLHSQPFSNSRLRNSKCRIKPALLSPMVLFFFLIIICAFIVS